MKARKAVVCPRCGARNSPNWEVCARCNESLEGAQTAEGPVSAEEEGEAAPPSLPAPVVALVGLLALAVGGAVAWHYASRTPPPSRPDPAMFTIPTRPAEPREVPPPSGPGAADYDAGRRLMHAGDLPGALARLAAAVAADPQNAEYHNTYGHALWRSGDRDRALAEHRDAARLDPRLQMQYARSLDVAGRSEEAAREYEALLALHPDASVVREDLGRLLFRAGDYAKAAGHLQAAVEAHPDDPVLQQELAYSLDQSGDRERASEVYRKVLEAAPGAVVTRALLAENLYVRGQKDEAMALVQEGLRQTPEAPLLQRQMGSLLERSGRRAEAVAAYRAYARLAPNAPDSKQMADRAATLEAAGRKR